MRIKAKAMTILAAMTLILGCKDDVPTLYLYNWSDYIDPTIIQDFEREYRCRISITTFDSNEAAYAKLKSGASGYDIMFPSSYIIPLMAREGMLQKLNHFHIPTVRKNFDHSFDSQICDSNLTYSVPYAATYGGLVYDKTKVTNVTDETSWKILETQKVRISLLDDIRETMGIGLMMNGYSINSENPEEIEVAVRTILKLRENVCKFDSESYKTEVPNGSTAIGHGYSSDASQIILGESEGEGRDDIGFLLPKEGFSICFDEVVILKESRNKLLAYEFIDFLYRPENALKTMIYNYSPCPNSKAIENLPEKYRKAIVLEEKIARRGQVMKEFSNSKTMDLYNRGWDEIRSLKNGK